MNEPSSLMERWWLGLALLVFWAVLIMTVTRCKGGEVKLTWNANPAGDGVTEYRIYRIEGTTPLLLAMTPATAATVEAQPGWTVAVTAYNGKESAPSAPVTIPAPMPAPNATLLTIEKSTDLQTWQELAAFYDAKQTKVFYRLKIRVSP